MVKKTPLSLRSTDPDGGKRPLAFALRILARRDTSAAEISRRLKEQGIPAEQVNETVARLQEAGYLDDRRFAREWAASALRNGRGFGPRIRLDLRRLGVSADIIDEVMAHISGEYDEMETLNGLLERKFIGFSPSSASDKEKRRVMHYLQRRGFSSAAIFQAFRMGEDY